jgi:hypothetical protein
MASPWKDFGDMQRPQGNTNGRGGAFVRRPPPDYTQRSVKLRLFLYLAAIMLVAGVIERVRDPAARQWLANLDHRAVPQEPFNNRLADRGLRTAADPAGTFVAAADAKFAALSSGGQIDPVERAWQQGWKDVFARLPADEQSLLFEILHAARAHGALAADRTEAAARLIQKLPTLWDDYQAAAFQSVADLKGDDPAQWIDVLRQTHDRFAEICPALQAIVDRRTPTETEENAAGQLQTTLVALAQREIQDDTVVFRPAEREAWFYDLGRMHDADAEQLRKSTLGRVAYLQLSKQPADYRGKLVTIVGTVRLAYRVPAPDNYLGIKEYCVYWLHPAGGPDSPIVVYAIDTPPGFPPIGDRQAGAKRPGKLREDVAVTGVFFKRCAYAAQGGTFTAPLLIAKVPDWQPPAETPARGPAALWELVAAAIVALILAICVTAVLWKRSSESHRAARQQQSGGFADLGPLVLGPTPAESLRELERHARGEGNP